MSTPVRTSSVVEADRETSDLDRPAALNASASPDPVSESYRSIIDVINRTSAGFKEGKKWKCSVDHHHHHRSRRRRQRRDSCEECCCHSDLDNCCDSGGECECDCECEGSMSSCGEEDKPVEVVSANSPSSSGDAAGKTTPSGRASKRLVRQTAAEDESTPLAACTTQIIDETTPLTAPATRPTRLKSDHHHHHLRVQMPIRQWTIDGGGDPLNAGVSGSGGGAAAAYLLRPVSRSSTASASHNALIPSPDPTCKSPSAFLKSPVRERIRLIDVGTRSQNSSFNRSVDSSCSGAGGRASNRIYERALQPHLQHANRRKNRLAKQRTSDSAPTNHNMGQPDLPKVSLSSSGASSRMLPRQHSNASAYSTNTTTAAVIPCSHSHQGITLVRGASCSLVDIPTYLGPSLAVEVVSRPVSATNQTHHQLPNQASTTSSGSDAAAPKKQQQPQTTTTSQPRPRLQLDLRSKSNADKSAARKTQWTVLCVSLTLLTLAVTLVGTMLSIGSQYQEMLVPRRTNIILNQTYSPSSSSSSEETFVIFPEEVDEDDEERVFNSTAAKTSANPSRSGEKEREEENLLFLPELAEEKLLLGLPPEISRGAARKFNQEDEETK